MNEDLVYNNIPEDIERLNAQAQEEKPEHADNNLDDAFDSNMTIAEILKRIDWILKDNFYIKNVLSSLEKIQTQPNDHGAGMKSNAMAEIVQAREETSRQTLRFLEKMYDDQKREQKGFAGELKDILGSINPGTFSGMPDILVTTISEGIADRLRIMKM